MPSLKAAFNAFMTVSDRPALLAVHTPADVSAEVLRNYFKNDVGGHII